MIATSGVENGSAATKEHMDWIWTWLPSLDGQTITSLTIGLAVTLATFYLGYRKTIGAREERLRAANLDLTSSILRRIAVEHEVVTEDQFEAIRKAKGYRSAISSDRLLSLDQTLDIVLAETIDNNFIDKGAKSKIVALVEDSRRSRTDGAQLPALGSATDSRSAVAKVTVTIVSLMAGLLTTFLAGAGEFARSEWRDIIVFLPLFVIAAALYTYFASYERASIERDVVRKLEREQSRISFGVAKEPKKDEL